MTIKINKTKAGNSVTVFSIAVVSPDLKSVQCFLDETVPGYKEQITKYKMKGFIIVHLKGESYVPSKRLSLSKNEVKEKLDPYFEEMAVEVIVRKLGF